MGYYVPPMTPLIKRVQVCDYCKRPAEGKEGDLCKSCGAPLPKPIYKAIGRP